MLKCPEDYNYCNNDTIFRTTTKIPISYIKTNHKKLYNRIENMFRFEEMEQEKIDNPKLIETLNAELEELEKGTNSLLIKSKKQQIIDAENLIKKYGRIGLLLGNCQNEIKKLRIIPSKNAVQAASYKNFLDEESSLLKLINFKYTHNFTKEGDYYTFKYYPRIGHECTKGSCNDVYRAILNLEDDSYKSCTNKNSGENCERNNTNFVDWSRHILPISTLLGDLNETKYFFKSPRKSKSKKSKTKSKKKSKSHRK